ncbi:hypothetical protein AAFN46_10405 [Pseudomonas sp. CAU 1711]|uniref:hypothetical protein n=1 Tax=Pseudomonas sp. CAU 1711 TaxID=3140356 RepID=UPI00325FE7D1
MNEIANLPDEKPSPTKPKEPSTETNNKLEQPRHPLEEVVAEYLSSLRNIGQTINIVMPHLAKWISNEAKKLNKELQRFAPKKKNDNNEYEVVIDSAHGYAEFTSTVKKIEELRSNKALPTLARSLFMQMFCEFDAFTGALIKAIYLRNSDLFKGISREISLAELLDFEDLECVKKVMLEKEIETFRRDSYVEQFAQLERKFNLTLRKFPEWGEFIELSQRRNLFTHNDGVVSEQYLAVCQREGLPLKDLPKIGDTLRVDLEYFGRALRIMSKVGYMLCHTLWSKVFPKEHQELHNSLNSNLYHCLEGKRWKVAAELGEFALSEPMRKNIKEVDFRIRVINCAIALKFSDKEDAAYKLLGTLDWSASYRDFKLALCILQDKFEEASELMTSIGKSGELIQQHSYHTWPLFHKFRELPQFYATYEEIYGVSYLAEASADMKNVDIALMTEEPTKELNQGAKPPRKRVSKKKA